MKKLLIDVNPVVPYYVTGRTNGIGRTTLNLIEALGKVRDIPFEISLYSQNMKGIGYEGPMSRFPRHHLYMPHRERWNRVLARFPVREWLTGYDVMHIPNNFEFVRHPERCVVTLHDAFFMRIHDSRFDYDKMRRLTPPFIRRCRHILTCSEYSKRDIVDTIGVSPEKITVIPWGIDPKTFHPSADPAATRAAVEKHFGIPRPYFLSVSCHGQRKRADVLTRAYLNLLRERKLTHDLVLVWGDPPAELVRKAAAAAPSSRVHFLSGLSDADLLQVYQAAAALIFPSAYEGFGLPVLEAMACGVPVVTCSNSSLPEAGGDAAIYIEEPIARSLGEAMLRLERGDFALAALAERGLERASRFTWDRVASETLKVYAAALEQKT